MKKLFRPHIPPTVAVQRPDGYPHSDVIKEFLKDCKDLDAIISIIPGTNHMFLMRQDREGRVVAFSEIQPGDWVAKEQEEIFIVDRVRFETVYEEIPDAQWEPFWSDRQ